MSEEAILRVRLSRELKERGGVVLAREGFTPSQAVRALYTFVDEHQTLPDFMKDSGDEIDVYKRRRQGIERLVGVVELPDGYDVEQLKSERLARYMR